MINVAETPLDLIEIVPILLIGDLNQRFMKQFAFGSKITASGAPGAQGGDCAIRMNGAGRTVAQKNSSF